MEQTLIIRNYDKNKEDNNILKMDYTHKHFSTYEKFDNYLHIQLGNYNDLNIYIQMNPYEAERVLEDLLKKVKELKEGEWI
ncbi:hypothetical protein AB1283_01105 [Bacillus sp. S13(2024)]|uniref:hypothetical protein n=1 Tax=Bacillus sp. S13(2024) TaxID=3162885 RepID=UPI003D1A0067